MNTALQYLFTKFKPELARRGGTEIHSVNRTIMAKTLAELGFTTGAEIGVAEGRHAKILFESNPNLKLFCIDIWEKYPNYHEYENIEQIYPITQELLKNHNVHFLKKFSMDAVQEFEDNSLDFVYIDAAHDFKNVAMDICEWSKKVRVGGIVFGHDYKRTSHASRNKIEVKDVVDAYMYSKGITPWFVLTNDITDPHFGPDNPGWLYVRQESDQL